MIELILPAGVCECSFSVWINKVWDILMKYKDQVEIINLSSDSPRAKELSVGNRTIVVNGEITPIFTLDSKLKKLLRI